MLIKEVLLTAFYLLLINFLILRFKKLQFRSFKPFFTAILFNIKFLAGIFLWCVYTFYYKDVQNNDVHKFYNDASVLRDVAKESPQDFVQIISGTGSHDARFEKYYSQMKNWRRNFDEAPFNENQTVIKLNALLMFLSFKTYFVHILFMCFISLLGWILITNAVMRYAEPHISLLVIPVMLLPSVLFWTSGVMKEPLFVLGLGLFISAMLNPSFRSAQTALYLLTGFFTLLLIKFFVLACLIPAAISFLLFRKKEGEIPVLLKFVIVNIVCLAIAFNLHTFIPAVNPAQMLTNKQSAAIKEAGYFNAGSRIDIPVISPGGVSILKAAPMGIWNTLFRPYPWEGKNVMMLASAVENILIFGAIILCLIFSDMRNFRQFNLFLFLLNFSLAYFALIGICTPVIGNLVRYRAPVLPFLLFALILTIRPFSVPAKLKYSLL